MDYQKIYESIINTAKQQKRIKHRGVYYESHHIIPKCLNGSNDKENLVLLTAKEHFVCHKLLTKIYTDNVKVFYAFHLMTCMNTKKYKIGSRDYSYLRHLSSSITIKRSDETRKRISKSKMGHIPWNKGKHDVYSKETKKIIGFKSSLKKLSEHTKQLISTATKGENNPMYGTTRSEETKTKIKQKLIGKKASIETCLKHRRREKCKHCGFETNISNLNRYHNDNCKYK